MCKHGFNSVKKISLGAGEKVKKYFTVITLVIVSLFVINTVQAEEGRLINAGVINSGVEYSSAKHARDYVLGVNDVISIFVYDSEEFNQEKMRILPDGNIILAPLGQIKAAGKTVEEFHNLLVDKYKFYLKEPLVTIRLDQARPFIAYITGSVLNPGSYELNTDTSDHRAFNSQDVYKIQVERKSPLLSNLLIAAGGIKFDADLEHVKITNPKTNTDFDINLMDIIEKGDVTQDIYLMEGDVVHVPSLPTPFAVNEEKYKKYITSTFSPKYVPVRVFGYVSTPGLIRLDSSASITLNSAIMAAGGYLTDAAYAPREVYISRPDVSGKLVTRKVNPMKSDVMVMPNDIVYVPEKARPLIAKAFEAVTKILMPFNTFANTYNNWALMSNPTRYQVIGK